MATGTEQIQPGLYTEAAPWSRDVVTILFPFSSLGTAPVLHAGWMTQVCSVVGTQRLAHAAKAAKLGGHQH